MQSIRSIRLLTPGLALAALLSIGCQAERAVIAPVEPTWSYHDGSTQLSNNDAWNKMIPSTNILVDASQVASVEEPTR